MPHVCYLKYSNMHNPRSPVQLEGNAATTQILMVRHPASRNVFNAWRHSSTASLTSLVCKQKIKTLVSVNLSGILVRLVCHPFLSRHRSPLLLLLLVQVNQKLALDQQDYYCQRQNRDTDLVAIFVVRRIPRAINLAADETPSILLLATLANAEGFWEVLTSGLLRCRWPRQLRAF